LTGGAAHKNPARARHRNPAGSTLAPAEETILSQDELALSAAELLLQTAEHFRYVDRFGQEWKPADVALM
jgi:hypothetical protein